MTLKYSRQREAIKDFLMTRKDHPTADVVYSNVRTEFPNISLGTVYRNLNLLAESGEILRLSCGDSTDHFDATVTPHYHFVCRKCDKILDLEMSSLDFIEERAAENFQGKVQGHQVYFYGECEDCMST